MGVFNPTLENMPAPEAPVSQPQGFSTAGALLDLGSSLLGSVQPKEAKGPSEAELKREALGALYGEFERADQLEAQGNTAGARTARNKALSSYNGTGRSLTDADVEGLSNRSGGRDLVSLLHGQGAAQINEIRDSEEFSDAYALAVQQTPDGNPESWEQLAMTNVFGQKALKAETAQLAAQDTRQWNQNTRKVLKGNIDNFVSTSIGNMTLIAQSGQPVTADVLFESKSKWDQVKLMVNTLKPMNVPEKDWKAMQEQMSAVDTFFESTISNVDNMLGLEVSTTHLAVANYLKDRGAPKAIIASFLDSPSKFIESSSKYFEGLLESTMDLFGEEMETPSVIFVETDITSKTLPEPEEVISPTLIDNVSISKEAIKGNAGVLKADIDFDNNNEAKLFESSAQNLSAQLVKMSKEDTLATQAVLQEVLSDGFMQNVYKLSATNPELSKKVLTQVSTAMGELQTKMVSYLDTAGKNQGIGVDALGKVTLLPSAFEPEEFNIIMEAVDTFYAGDIEKFIAENGRKVPAMFDPRYQKVNHLFPTNGEETLKVVKGLSFLQSRQRLFEGIRGVPKESNVPEFVTMMPTELQSNSEFVNGVQAISTEFGVNPSDLVKIMHFETAGNFRTGNHGNGSSATGLIGFMAATAKDMGTSVQHLASLKQHEQLPYVAQYFKMHGLDKVENPDIVDIYTAVIWPAAMGKPEHYVLFQEGSKEYAANKSLDTDGDGYVTRGDLRTRMNQYQSKGRGGSIAPGPVYSRPPEEEVKVEEPKAKEEEEVTAVETTVEVTEDTPTPKSVDVAQEEFDAKIAEMKKRLKESLKGTGVSDVDRLVNEAVKALTEKREEEKE